MASDSGGDSNDDSRTAVVAAPGKLHASAKSSASNSPSGARRRKRSRAKRGTQKAQDIVVPKGANFSESAAYLDPSASANLEDPVPNAQSSEANLDMNLGSNRLATGFGSAKRATAKKTSPKIKEKSNAVHSAADDPIEISSSDESIPDSDDDDGGMIVNIDNNSKPPIHRNRPVEHQTTIHSSPQAQPPAQSPPQSPPSTRPAAPSQKIAGNLKLEDLNSDELELQIRYTLFHLRRDQIDLNRPVTCLTCLQQGHMSSECVENNCGICQKAGHSSRECPSVDRCSKCRKAGHEVAQCTADASRVPCDICGNLSHVEHDCPQRFFPQPDFKSTEGGPVKLWISCCVCASRSHLVGDCPDADPVASAGWSLKRLAPGQFVNRSLEAGIHNLEAEAENRGMRPPGMQIRGRSDVRHAVHSSEESSDADDRFLRPVNRNAPRNAPNFNFGSVQPHFQGSGRNEPRGQPSWHATDSFGQRRSRSPRNRNPGNDQWRPTQTRERSPRRFDYEYQNRPRSPPRQPPMRDTYRPDDWHYRQPAQHPLPNRPPTMTLPTRKGSNPNLAPIASRISDPPGRANTHAAGSRKKKNKKAKVNSPDIMQDDTAIRVDEDDESDVAEGESESHYELGHESEQEVEFLYEQKCTIPIQLRMLPPKPLRSYKARGVQPASPIQKRDLEANLYLAIDQKLVHVPPTQEMLAAGAKDANIPEDLEDWDLWNFHLGNSYGILIDTGTHATKTLSVSRLVSLRAESERPRLSKHAAGSEGVQTTRTVSRILRDGSVDSDEQQTVDQLRDFTSMLNLARRAVGLVPVPISGSEDNRVMFQPAKGLPWEVSSRDLSNARLWSSGTDAEKLRIYGEEAYLAELSAQLHKSSIWVGVSQLRHEAQGSIHGRSNHSLQATNTYKHAGNWQKLPLSRFRYFNQDTQTDKEARTRQRPLLSNNHSAQDTRNDQLAAIQLQQELSAHVKDSIQLSIHAFFLPKPTKQLAERDQKAMPKAIPDAGAGPTSNEGNKPAWKRASDLARDLRAILRAEKRANRQAEEKAKAKVREDIEDVVQRDAKGNAEGEAEAGAEAGAGAEIEAEAEAETGREIDNRLEGRIEQEATPQQAQKSTKKTIRKARAAKRTDKIERRAVHRQVLRARQEARRPALGAHVD